MRKPEPDPYAILGVARTASDDEIRAAYRELVAKYHPDRHQGNPLEGLAAEKMAEINRAYEILSDPERRASYDRGDMGFGQAGSPFTTVRGGGRKRKPWLYVLGLLLLLPLLIRLGVFVARLLARAVRFSFEGLAGLRGTPAALVAVALVAAIAVTIFVRRRRRRR
jgi:hypothetical protein